MANNIKTIAQEVGVSLTTVSRALNNHPHVNPEIRDKVFAAALKLGYQPKISAEKKRLAIIINDRSNELFGFYDNNMLFQLISECDRRNITTEIFGFSNINLLDENFLKVAIFFQDFLTEKVLTRFAHTQFIGINNPVPGALMVCSDDAQGLGLAFSYFKKTGHRRIALIMQNKAEVQSITDRTKIFCQLSCQYGEKDPEALIAYVCQEKSLENIATLIRVQKPDALLVGGEDMLLRVNYVLNLLGIVVPDDLSVISFENLFASQYMVPPHTTIRQNFEQLAATAVDFAAQIFAGKTPDKNLVVLPDSLVERNSVKKRFYGSSKQ